MFRHPRLAARAAMLGVACVLVVGRASVLGSASQGGAPAEAGGVGKVATIAALQARKQVEDLSVHVPISVLGMAFAVTIIAVVIAYSRRGLGVALSVCMYLTALSTIKWTVKWVFVTCAFPFPQFLTMTHSVACGLFVLPILLQRRSQTGVEIVKPTAAEMFLMIVPIAAASSISIAANNMALNFCSVAFVMIVASSSCLCTVGMVVLLGMPFDLRLLAPTVAVVIGCAISSLGEINFSLLGMALCFLSNAFRAIRGALQQKLLIGESRDKFDPCSLLFWCSLPSVALTLFGSLTFEGLEPWRRLAAMDQSALSGLALALGASCVNAAGLNLANLFVTKHLGAVGAQMVAQVRAVLAVLGGVAIFGEPVSRLELLGFAVVLGGVYAFASMEESLKQQKAAKQ